ncbi:[protein release factor]-glutamine N5-methyltransferase [Pseudorhodobacter antarcticus]|uniref:Release factor glutamine methyltransferase n=1 Tax=Pseudorhodobacter antarcticus TaxID=1077947 RepID=A0A1H8DHG8_9RHOB|nr:peptide chain release factor N(5)-glutamine methyltransferase [Pseudorhodobacter antarcticus]SEN06772.1 [protein release factor]-glutamine N5-methyltransferase [Pseudorhodobacter antarcticus]
MTTLLAARRAGLERLLAAGVPGAAQDMALLLAHVLGLTRADLALLSPQIELTESQVAALEAALTARTSRKPMSHITGHRMFWGRSFAVTPAVLDPRPETETLIAAALTVPFASVLDLGTGSGCILLTLMAERAAANGVGVDLSDAALVVARANHARFGGYAHFVQGSWFDPVQGTFDLIVSNPPYIAADEMAGLSPEVRNWEPHLALTPGGDGLAAYRHICAGAAAHLTPNGWLMVEIGPRQGAHVSTLFALAGFESVGILPDLDGRDRVVIGQIACREPVI